MAVFGSVLELANRKGIQPVKTATYLHMFFLETGGKR